MCLCGRNGEGQEEDNGGREATIVWVRERKRPAGERRQEDTFEKAKAPNEDEYGLLTAVIIIDTFGCCQGCILRAELWRC